MTPINSALPALDTWTELSGFQQLRAQARSDGGKGALPAVAKQFEAIFTQMMLKSMRDANASMGSDIAGSEQVNSYRDMFDQQLSLSLANGHNGLGIAKMLVRQLGGKPDAAAATAADASQGLPLSTAGVLNANVRALLQLGADRTAAGGDGAGDAAGGFGMPGVPSTADAGSSWRQALDRMAQGALEVAGTAAKLLPGGDPVNFVRALAPHAAVAAKQLGVSVRALLAQAALETGWGKHLPSHGDGSSSNNLFGIKAGGSWGGDKVSVPTLEYENGVAVRKRDQFRAYDSPSESFSDYARLLAGSPRYAQALGQGEDIAGFARALVHGGYATDPSYVAKITAIANSAQMREALAALRQPDGLK
ncbi:flagellar assembly peptidoglycan hydrolase FlgJ [Rhodanobacter umsongensis]|uniref:Peptidoglycan hydrolase FlgJ n=1 Tax=Rhodanobacter umsongensis TaxID=633153 RepID=A0ABW0JL63_9GAMM